ncbi:hypothetical protein TYRP_021335 [Tyrophagus putrescentiae]|nr:hypothetical protein TYRP_021335 [Tyrophagus putrescentiae]
MYLCLRLSKCQISLSKLRFEEFICGPQFSAFAVTVGKQPIGHLQLLFPPALSHQIFHSSNPRVSSCPQI